LETEEDLSRKARWETNKLLQRRDLIVDAVAAFHDQLLTAEIADGIATTIELKLGWLGTKYPIRNTLLLHTGTVFTKAHWRQVAWQIAANKDRLKLGIPLAPFAPAMSVEWVITEIIGVAASRARSGAEAAELEFRVLTGANAGFSFKEHFIPQALYSISRDLGYNRQNKYDGNPLMLFGFRLAAKLAEGRIERIFCPPSIKAENRAKVRLRRRDVIMPVFDRRFNNDGTERKHQPLQYGCPRDFDHPCWECQLTTAACIAAYK
jgi:hypothetical protein